MADVKIGKFDVKKGTIVLPQISSVLFDERVNCMHLILKMRKSIVKFSQIFPFPLEFRPERFLDENGQFTKSDALIPFGIGRRFSSVLFVSFVLGFKTITVHFT